MLVDLPQFPDIGAQLAAIDAAASLDFSELLDTANQTLSNLSSLVDSITGNITGGEKGTHILYVVSLSIIFNYLV